MADNIVSLFNERLNGHSALKTALVLLRTDGTEENYSWNDYGNKAIYVTEWLKSHGVKRGDFVAIIPLNLPESFFAMMGIILAGAVPVPINVQLLKESGLVDLKRILDDCKPKLVLTNEFLYEFLPKIELCIIGGIIGNAQIHLSHCHFYPVPSENDLLILPYTSGTSGQPKGVMLTHKNVLNRLKAAASAFGVTNDERILSYLPLGHIAELITTFFGQIYCGYTVYFTEYAKETMSNSEKYGKNFPTVLQQVQPTIFIAVPRIWMSFRKEIEAKAKNLPIPGWIIPQWLKKSVIKKRLGFSQTRVFISAAAKISDEDREFFANLGISIADIYGQTETAGPLTLNGAALGPNNKIALEKEEITVVGNCVMAGYYQNPSADAQAFSKNETSDVIYHTGDTGITREGKIFWTGRIGKGFKLANGEYASPDKIEFVEEEIKKIDPRITEVMLCGLNRPYLVALIFSEKYTNNDLREKIRQQLPRIGEGMINPKRFVLIDVGKLELTPTFKLKGRVMLEKLQSEINSLYTK